VVKQQSKKREDKKLSLRGVKFEDAVRGLLQTPKPGPKKKAKRG
jgi:hypothetical protein